MLCSFGFLPRLNNANITKFNMFYMGQFATFIMLEKKYVPISIWPIISLWLIFKVEAINIKVH